MKSAKLLLMIAVTSIFAAACGNSGTLSSNQGQPTGSPATSAATATPDQFASARANFQKHCVVCHGATGDGGLVTVEGKKFKVPTLRAGHAVDHSDDRLAKQIREGDDDMPAFEDKLSTQEITDLVRFIRKEYQGK